MIGIPYRIQRDSDEGGAVDKTLYLATRRMGEAGKAFKTAKKAYYAAQQKCAKAALKYKSLEGRQDKNNSPALRAQQEAALSTLLDAIRETGEESVEAAERVVRLSLAENYGREKAEEILDGLLDRDLHGIVQALEMGEQPEDFFPARERRQKQTATSPAAG